MPFESTPARVRQRLRNRVEGRLALAWLAFEPRLDLVEGEARDGGDRDRQAYSEARASKLETLKASFRDDVLRKHRTVSGEDFDAASNDLVHKSLQELVGLVRRGFEIKVSLANRAPRIAFECLTGWYEATDEIDGDSLICHVLAEQGRAREIEQFDRWTLIARIGDHDIDRLMEAGVSDMHLHLGGLRSAHLTWLKLMGGLIHPEALDYFSSRKMTKLSVNKDEQQRRKREKERILWLRQGLGQHCDETIKRCLYRPLGRYWGRSVAPRLMHLPPEDPEWIPHLLACERSMLVRGFSYIDDCRRREKNGEKAAWAEWLAVQQALDLYIQTKSRFIANHRQAVSSNPGLSRHRQMGDTTKLWTDETKSLRSRLARGRPREEHCFPRLRGLKQQYGDFAYYLSQCPDMRRVELRFAPDVTRASDYRRFLDAWQAVENDFATLRPRGLQLQTTGAYGGGASGRHRPSDTLRPAFQTLARPQG